MIINVSKSSYFMVIIMNTYIIRVPVSSLIIKFMASLITEILPENVYISIEGNGEWIYHWILYDGFNQQ